MTNLFVGIDHLALFVADVTKSVHFYHNILGFEVILRPAFNFEGAWFAVGPTQQLHLIGHREVPVPEGVFGPRQNHFAIQVTDIQAAAAFLREKNISFTGPKPRPDGMLQIFFQDPDGYWIEFNGE